MEHALKGRKQSPEHVANRKAAWQKSPAKEKTSGRFTDLNKSRTGKPLSDEQKKKISEAMKGKRNSLGVQRPKEFREKLSKYWAENKEKHPRYKDGLGAVRGGERRFDMGRLQYRLWRESVFERDNWKCVQCGRGGKVCADHIKAYSQYPELRYEVSNGRTLCLSCHIKTENYGHKANRV